jgi:DNA-damage-inducible protein D
MNLPRDKGIEMGDSDEIGKALGLGMSTQEAMKIIAQTAKDEAQPLEPGTELIAEGHEQITLFKGTEVRQVFHDNEWWFSIVDVVAAVTETDRPAKYWSDLKSQLSDSEGFSELSGKIGQLKMKAHDGKMRETDVVNVETLFRIVQSIPSKKAEPFKKWLAKVGYERIQEIQNPEIGVKRAILQWQVDGRTSDWIDARIRAIVTRKELTDEWKARGIQGPEYGYLTDVISKQTFGIKTSQHKAVKGLKNQSLRDHMTDLELIFTMLGEKSTAAIASSMNSQGLQENVDSAMSGGKVAGDARLGLERKLGRRVVSAQNFLKGNSRVLDTEKLTAKKPTEK